MTALITNINRPKVRMVIGMEIIANTGFTKTFRIDKTKATKTAEK